MTDEQKQALAVLLDLAHPHMVQKVALGGDRKMWAQIIGAASVVEQMIQSADEKTQ